MNRFRYDVVLRLGSSAKERIEPLWQDWSRNELTFELIRERLRHQAPEILAFAGIKNARIEKDNLALESMMGKDAFPGVTELKELVDSATLDGVHPEKLFLLAAESGYQMDFSWACCRSDGSYDVIFYRIDHWAPGSRPTFSWPRPVSVSCNLAHHVVGPVWIDHRRKWVRHLRDCLMAKLGEHCVPADFVVLDAMPNTRCGDIDHAALPLPWLSCV